MTEPGRWTLDIGYRSDVGRVREMNEDSFLALTAPHLASDLDVLLAVADGMGGHQAGEVASEMAVRCLEQWFTSGDYRARVAYNPGHPDYFVVVLKEALEALNQALYHMATSNSSMAAMGTTATVALIQGPHLFIGHVGDSRAYLLHADRLSRLTQDHTWVAEQVQAGRLSPAQAARHPRRHVLTRALGQASLVRVDRDMHALAPGDTILLCSDGLHSVVTEQIIYQALRSAPTAQATCDQLVTLANQHGGPDNISVLAARLRPAGSGNNLPEGRSMGPADRRTSAAPPPPSTLDAQVPGYVIAHLRGLLGRCAGWIARQWVRSGAPAREQAKE